MDGGMQVVIVTILLTGCFLILMGGILGMMILLFVKRRNKKNNIDFVIYDMYDKTCSARKEIGRCMMGEKGKQYFTVYPISGKIKDNLGYNLTEDNMVPSKLGINRKFCVVAMKDGIPAQVELKRGPMKKIMADLSDEEKTLFHKLVSKHIVPANMGEIPESLGLSPVKYEISRFVIDSSKDAAKMYQKKKDDFSKLVMISAISLLFIVVIGTIVLVALLMTIGPDFAAQTAKIGAPVVANQIPMVPVVPG